MAKDVDLSSKEWRDLVFEGKNKDFGAYELRQGSPKRHNWAMVAVVVFILALFAISYGIDKMVTEEEEAPKSAINQAELDEFIEETEEDMDIPEQIEMPEEVIMEEEPVLTTEKVTEIEILPDEMVTEPPKSQDQLQTSTEAVGTADVEGTTEDITAGKVIQEEAVVAVQVPEPPKDDNKVFETVEQDPQFPGGQEALLKWVAEHIKYPAAAQENNIQGRVVVQFVVTKTGSVGTVKVVRGKDPDLDKEAVRVVKSLPKFTPGKMNGHAVNVWYTLPITFKLQGV